MAVKHLSLHGFNLFQRFFLTTTTCRHTYIHIWELITHTLSANFLLSMLVLSCFCCALPFAFWSARCWCCCLCNLLVKSKLALATSNGLQTLRVTHAFMLRARWTFMLPICGKIELKICERNIKRTRTTKSLKYCQLVLNKELFLMKNYMI